MAGGIVGAFGCGDRGVLGLAIALKYVPFERSTAGIAHEQEIGLRLGPSRSPSYQFRLINYIKCEILWQKIKPSDKKFGRPWIEILTRLLHILRM